MVSLRVEPGKEVVLPKTTVPPWCSSRRTNCSPPVDRSSQVYQCLEKRVPYAPVWLQ